MDVYRYQELAYLAVPVVLGMEFFLNAKEENKGKEETPLGSYVLDLLGFVFTALLPSVFIFTIWAVESKAFPLQGMALAKLDRYAVLFFFLGGWWQIFLFGALRARRMKKKAAGAWYLWGPLVILGVFISLLVLWDSPWNLKWISLILYFLIFGLLYVFKARLKTIERIMWGFSVITFILVNIMFILFESVV
ncbi:MAG TPA: hypothetical protein DCP92_06705 [Nitrospiraceae bacterium]|jgi:hypothetical protein|nr:hypothetical protein [Nitrospiraceae bacterium]